MPGAPIDEYSIKLNIDADDAIQGTIEAMAQIEDAWDQIVEAAKELGEVALSSPELVKAQEELDDVLQENIALLQAYGKTLQKAAAEGVDAGAATIAFANALKDVDQQIAAIAAQEYFELQQKLIEVESELDGILKKVSDAYVEQGKAIPIEKLEQLRKRLVRIGELGEEQGLTWTEISRSWREAMEDVMPPATGVRNILLDIATKVGAKLGINVPQALGKIQNLMGGMNKIAGALKISTGALTVAFGALAAALLAVVAIGGLYIKWANEGLQLALRNADVHERLALTVRIQQQAIGDLALSHREAVNAAAELGKTFGITQIKAEELLATAINLTRQFKLTGDETIRLAEAAVILGTAAGLDSESALRSITNFMLTGYTQGLQQLGITISDLAIRHRAFKQGLVSLTGEVDDATKAEMARQIIMEEAEKQRQLAIDSTDTYAQRIETSTDAINTAKESLGNMLTPLKAWAKEIEEKVITVLIKVFQSLIAALVIVETRFGTLFQSLGSTAEEFFRRVKAGESLKGLGDFFSDEQAENLERNLSNASEALKDWFGLADDFKDKASGLGETFEELTDRIGEAALELADKLEKLQQKFDDAMARIEQRLRDAMAKITKDFGRRRRDAALDLTRDMRDIDASAQESAADAARKHNQDLFRIEEDHKLAMERLEDQFLFDLEDAVRERDARGVLMAIRRFNQQKKEMLQDKNIRTRRLKEDFKNELQEIELERRRRRAERMLEFAEQSDDLAIQEARRREDALTAFANSERDLIAANKRKERILADGFLAQFVGTNIAMNALYELMYDYIGPGGFMEGLYDSIARYAAETNLNPNLSGFLQSDTITDDPNPDAPGHARGGTLFATSPTLEMFGEGGPERVDFTPLSQSTGLPRAGFGNGGGGGQTDINLEVALEDGLEAEIVDQTMDGVANVITTMTKKRKQGAR